MMTPERKEEIKTLLEASEIIDWHTLRKITKELFAALEETEKQLAEKTGQVEYHQNQISRNYEMLDEKRKPLAEAQQTIARLTEEVKEIRGKHIYVSGPSVVYELLGRLIEAYPPCPICPHCGSENTIDHPSRPDIRLCVPCDKIYTVLEGCARP